MVGINGDHFSGMHQLQKQLPMRTTTMLIWLTMMSWLWVTMMTTSATNPASMATIKKNHQRMTASTFRQGPALDRIPRTSTPRLLESQYLLEHLDFVPPLPNGDHLVIMDPVPTTMNQTSVDQIRDTGTNINLYFLALF